MLLLLILSSVNAVKGILQQFVPKLTIRNAVRKFRGRNKWSNKGINNKEIKTAQSYYAGTFEKEWNRENILRI